MPKREIRGGDRDRCDHSHGHQGGATRRHAGGGRRRGRRDQGRVPVPSRRGEGGPRGGPVRGRGDPAPGRCRARRNRGR
ncbi:MAG TPA: hypothetical protein EYP73_07395 [Acidimicrobiia bacterium]|nr:hypothetical protein [Acidimicrobiia bacterium]